MTYMPWTAAMATNIEFIDKDHRILVDQINILADMIQGQMPGDAVDTLKSVMTTLLDYTELHFSREEKVFEEAGYSGAAGHKAQHDSFISKISEASDKFSQGSLSADKLLALLKAWLTAHILGEDMRMAEFLAVSKTRKTLDGIARHPGDLANLRVMVCNTDFHFRNLMKTILMSFGITRTVEAKDGAQALRELRDNVVDVVFADARMDVLDGLEFTRLLRVEATHNQQAIVILMPGADVTIDYVKQALAAGAHDVLRKPVSTRQVHERLIRHVRTPLPFVRKGKALVPDHAALKTPA